MHLHPQNRISKGCGSAHPQPYVSAEIAGFPRTSSSGRDLFIKQSGLNVQPSSYQSTPPCPPCYTQFTVVTCCCFFRQCTVREEKKSLSLPSPASRELEDTSHSQQPHRDSGCPVLRLAPSPTGEIAFPSWSPGLHICVDTGACTCHCCTRSHLGKRIFLAARRTLARFGLRRKRSVHSQSTSRTSTEHRGQPSTEQFLTHDSTSRIELQGHLLSEADSGMSCELPTREVDHASRELPAELSSEGYVPYEAVSILESSVPSSALSPHFAPPRIPGLCRPMLQASTSTLDTSFSDIHCPRSASGSQDSSDETTDEDLKELRNEEDDAVRIRYLSDNLEQGSASEAAAEDRNFATREMCTFAGRVEFCESPTSISGEMEFQKIGLKIDPYAATIEASAESSGLASR